MENDPGYWLKQLGNAAVTPEAQRLHTAAVEFHAALQALPQGGYRDRAECSLGDTLVLAYVAAR